MAALPTVETEVNGDSKRTNERDPFLIGSLGFSAGWPSTKYFFLTIDYFNSFVPIVQQVGQAAVLGRLSFSVCLWSGLLLT